MKERMIYSNTLLLVLFLHAMLIPSDIGVIGWVLSLGWSLLVLLAVPRLFYQIDRLRIQREVSAAMVLLFGIFVSLTFALIERSFFYLFDTKHLERMILFVLLSVLISRIENVYEAQHLSQNPKQIILTISVVLVTLLGSYAIIHKLMPLGVERKLITVGVWSFWQSSMGRTLMIIFFFLSYSTLDDLATKMRRRLA